MARSAKASGHYLNSMLAKIEAVNCGYNEAIVVSAHGHVTEGSAEYIFLLREGVIGTPPLSDGVLEGRTRDTVLRLMRREGIPVEQRSIGRSEPIVADEVSLTGTAAEVAPVREVDDRAIADQGPITRLMQALPGCGVRSRSRTRGLR
jgi:branched-chain amino acid aminotransferase